MTELKQEGHGALIGLAVAAVVVAGVIAIIMHLSSESQSEVTGTLTIDDDAFGPAHCRSGNLGEDAPRDRPSFHGVDLLTTSGDSGRSVRVLEDPSEGTSVLILDPNEAPRPVDRANCERFEVELGETDELIMDVWGMEGSIDLDCPTVSGQVSFVRCYSGG